MHYLNDWHDYLRVVAIFVTVYCLVTLGRRYTRRAEEWNIKTRDLWYSMLMWTISGIILLIQGIVFDRPFTPGTVALVAAVLVTGKGLNRKGNWGGGS